MPKGKRKGSGTTNTNETAMTTTCAVEKKEETVVSPRKIDLDDLPVADPGSANVGNNDFFDDVDLEDEEVDP